MNVNQPKTIAEQIFILLSWYPFLWTIGILIASGLLKSHLLMMSVMITWVMFVYIGFITWLILLVYLPLKKKIGIKNTLIHLSIFILGTYIAFYIVEHDIWNTGIKYMD